MTGFQLINKNKWTIKQTVHMERLGEFEPSVSWRYPFVYSCAYPERDRSPDPPHSEKSQKYDFLAILVRIP